MHTYMFCIVCMVRLLMHIFIMLFYYYFFIDVLLKMLKQERKLVAEREGLLKENGIRWTQRAKSPNLGRTSPISQLTTPTNVTTPINFATPSSTVTTPPESVLPRNVTTPTNDKRALLRAGELCMENISGSFCLIRIV